MQLNSDNKEKIPDKSNMYNIESMMGSTGAFSSEVSSKKAKEPGFIEWGKELVFFLVDIFLNAVIIVALVILIRFYVISPFEVSGPSMCDTLNYVDEECLSGKGEYIIVDKLSYKKWFGYQLNPPKRGDIVVFKPPLQGSQEFFIKRVIGLPGEKIRIKNGEVYVYNEKYPQGFRLEEDYLNVVNKGNTLPYSRGISEFSVPNDSYFLLGDNRKASSDSRHCFGPRGCVGGTVPYVPFENIEGKSWVVLLPFKNVRVIRAYNYEE